MAGNIVAIDEGNVHNGEAFYVSDEEASKLADLYSNIDTENRFGEMQKRDDEESYPILYNNNGEYGLINNDEPTAQKRHLCRKYFVYNPVRGRCAPTLMAYRKGRRSRNSYGWMSRRF